MSGEIEKVVHYVLAVCITRMSREYDLYEATRGNWLVNPVRTENVDYVFGVVNGEILIILDCWSI